MDWGSNVEGKMKGWTQDFQSQSESCLEQAGLRSPLIHILLPWIAGIAVASALGEFFPFWVWGGVAWVCFAVALIVIFRCGGFGRWWLFFTAGVFTLAVGYVQWFAVEPPPRWEQLPVREAELSLEVTRAFDVGDRYGRVSGLATVVGTPAHLSDLMGQSIAFNLIPAVPVPLYRGVIFRGRGELLHEVHWVIDEASAGFYRFLKDQGVSFRLQRGRILTMESEGASFYRFCAAANERLTHILLTGVDEGSPAYGVLAAMVLGKKSLLSETQTEQFIDSGTMHFFAISGLHVGILAGALYYILGYMPIGSAARALVGLALLYLYVQITGGSASAMRAFAMVVFFWGAQAVLRRPAPMPALVAAALLVLVVAPNQLWSPGFQLSYCVVAAILLYGVPLADRWQEYWQPERYIPRASVPLWLRIQGWVGRWLGAGLIVSLSATLASAPLVALYFGVFTPGAVVLNLLLFSLIGVLLVSGMGVALVGLVYPPLAGVFNPLLEQVIILIQTLLVWGLKLPGLFVDGIVLSRVQGLGGAVAMLAAFILATLPAVQRRLTWRVGLPLGVALMLGILYSLGLGR